MNRPPKTFLRFFRWFCHPRLQKPIEGDLMELYEERIKELGKSKANQKFRLDVLQLFRPSIIKPVDGTYRLTNYGMLKNYFRVSMRNILRNKTFSFLNVMGLSAGMASCILILIYVNHELSYDSYNEEYDNTYRIVHYYGNQEQVVSGDSLPINEYQVWGNAPVGPALKRYFPEVKSVFQFTSPNSWLVQYKNKNFQESNLIFADSTAFSVFSWPLLGGDPNTALAEPNTIVLTKQLAEKYFGDENPIGQVMQFDGQYQYEVTGVLDLPLNSHFEFDGLISMETFKNIRPQIFESWGYVDFYTYFTLENSATIEQVQARTDQFIKESFDGSYGYTIKYETLADSYLHSEAGRQPGKTGSLNNIYIFTSVAIFILLIACINFMNLSTARSVERAKEVAIRKTIGSNRKALISQFLVEAIVLTFIAAVFACGLIVVGHSYLEFLSGKTLPVEWLFSAKNVLSAIGALIFIGSIAGSYPAFVLSGFKPVKVLKGSFKTSSGGVWLRKSLVVFQFTLSIILLVGATVVSKQLSYLGNHDLGFDPEQVMVIDFGYDQKVQQQLKSIKAEFLKHSDVVNVSASRATPGDFFPNAGTGIADPISGELVYKDPAIYEVDEDFVPTFKMSMAAGRNYSKDFQSDSANSMLLNEAAARFFGYPNPEDVIGKSFEQWGREGTVVGVIKDFNYVSLHKEVEPLTLRYSRNINASVISLRINSSDYGRTLNELESIWNEVAPHYPFVTKFTNANFNKQYEADQRFGMIFTVFSSLAIFVACLGLFGLTIYSTSQRTKEIGIRKVLGSSAHRIVSMLSLDFIKLFLVALVIAIPASWFTMQSWLDGFAYRISIGWEIFLIAAIVTLLISLTTMSFRTIKAALSNPIDALRNE
ncbi:MAG: ABC transporter permease [Cyclobacteriaceae bacterium]